MTLPVALAGNDVIGQAKTGTGKTLGFGLPLLERVTVPADVEAGRAQPEQLTDAPQALVVVPTRELCTQVTNDLLTAGKVRNVRVLAIYGGRAYEPQVEALKKGIDVVVGTPGRLLDLAGQKKLNLKHVRALVLDEADEMLDLGFLPDVEKIMNMLPVRRQTMLFSATMPGAVIGLARRYMSQPTHIRASEPDDVGATVANTKQHIYRAHNMDKPELVSRILQADGRGLAMVFCRTKRTAADLADQLQQRGFASGAVHGDLGQGAREQALRAFRNGKVDVLVCTDVAARGIDVEGVTHVINYQSPEDEKTYLHRIGRTGRAGAKGIAITLVDWDDIPRWQLINKALNLGFNDPPETYSTSPHLFEELKIPAGTKGVLPRSERTRAGLSAEVVEDLGETGGRGARGGRGGRPAAGPAPAAERDRDRDRSRDRDRDRDRSERTPRRRRRTRNGAALDAVESQNTVQTAVPSAPETVADSTEPGQATESRSARRRRRTRAGAGSEAAASAVATAEGTAVEVPEQAVVPAAVPDVAPVAEPVADAEAKPRRRRTRRTAEAVQPEAAVVEEAPVAEPTVVPAEAVVTKPRRRTRKTAVAEPAVTPVEAVADPVEVVEAKPRRTRKATAAKTTAAAETALDTAEAAEAKPRRRTRKAAVATESAEVTAVAETGIPAQATEEPEAKPRRRTRKAAATAAETAEAAPVAPAAAPVAPAEEAPVAEAKPRRRTRKAAVAAETAVDTAEGTTAEAPAATVTKPRRTRKAAATVEAAAAPAEAAESAVDTAEATGTKPRRRTRKAAVAEADIPAQATEAVADTAEAPVKPRRTRKTAAKTAAKATAPDAVAESAEAAPVAEAKPRRRTRKAAAAAEPTEG
ncbi:DEAD/DEAH box helicase [Streptomyces sp. NPDC020707]|uniref:DEAD/DEAH box helicase n=1 Tax=Streptomyces sp. NPDC020707 TaxID=3365084 RepID=UPI0037B59465